RVFKEEKDPIIWIDVRTPKEFSKKRIPGARSLPLNILQERFKAELPSEESKIFVYCSEGDRSCS
ncbi:MAG: rhodanese-like domain-containing protein, partial [Desulfobacterales bacterium]|nr:rhodanese-like domain-containing protein [Desulfobacterales bacterium]